MAGLAAIPPARCAWCSTLQIFHPAAGTGNFITTHGASNPERGTWMAGAVFDYADDLLLGPGGSKLLDSRLTVHALGSVALWRRLEVGAALPVAVAQRGVGDLDGASVGDARLVPKLRGFWLGDERRGLGAAFVAEVTFPSGSEDRGNGEPWLTFTPRLALELVRAGWDGALNLGYRVRESSGKGEREADDEVVLGAALRAPPLVGVQATLDAYAFVGVAVDAGRSEAAIPCEVLGGLRPVKLPWGLTAWIGGGAGVTRGYGSSDFRLLGALGYESRPLPSRPAARKPAAPAAQIPRPAPELE